MCDYDCVLRDNQRICCAHRSSSTYHFLSCRTTGNSSCVRTCEAPRTTRSVSSLALFLFLHLSFSWTIFLKLIRTPEDWFAHGAIWFSIVISPLIPTIVLSRCRFSDSLATVPTSFQTFPESIHFESFQYSIESRQLSAAPASTAFLSLSKPVIDTNSTRCKVVLLLI